MDYSIHNIECNKESNTGYNKEYNSYYNSLNDNPFLFFYNTLKKLFENFVYYILQKKLINKKEFITF
jgi:hypothetical protein